MTLNSIIKSFKLTKVSKKLDQGLPTSATDLLKQSERREKALEELFDICMKNKRLRELLEEHKIDKGGFKKIYNKLAMAGASQWVKSHFVSASSLAFGFTLRFILENMDKNNWEDIVFSLINYFEKGEMGKVEFS